MRAVTYSQPGTAQVLTLSELPSPEPQAEQLLVKVHAAGVNRADTLQRQGRYAAPQHHSPILGLEIAGEVVGLGPGVTRYQIGNRVFGLVDGGGYAEYALIDHQVAIPIPSSWSYVEAAAVAEVFLTSQVSLFELGELKADEILLLHAGGSGIGTASIQMAHYIGAQIFFTAGSDAKIERALALGADVGINYRMQNFEKIIQAETLNGVDVILDCIGGDYFPRNLNCLTVGGRLVQISVLHGSQSEIALGRVIMKRLQIKGNTMRSRPVAEKRGITERFIEKWLPVLREGKIKPVIDRVFSFNDVQHAHSYMEENRNFGKIILEW